VGEPLKRSVGSLLPTGYAFMKMYSFLSAILIGTFFFSIPAFRVEQASSENPSVIQAIPAPYPSIARNANISGVVLVEVAVDPGGNVTNVKTIEGHPILKLAAETAANKWKFNPLEKQTTMRSVKLSFRFTLIPSNKGTSGDLGVVFWPPYAVEVRDAPFRV
jgi:TonB family protein